MPIASASNRDDRALPAHFALLTMAVIWGVNFSVAKIALEALPPLAFNALRFPMAAALLYVVLRRGGKIPLPTRAQLPAVLALGLLGNVIYQLSFIFGLNLTSPGNASLLLAGTPIMTALLSAAVGQERVRPHVWMGVFATFAGILLVVLGASPAGGPRRATIAGDLLMLGASLTWACYTVGSRPLVERHGPVAITAWTLWAGTVGVVLAGIPSLLRLDWKAIDGGTWAATAYAGLLSIGLAYMLYYFGVSRIGNTRTASYSNIVPVFALLGAWFWLHETPKLVQVIGAAIIITGVTVAQSGALSRAPIVSPEV